MYVDIYMYTLALILRVVVEIAHISLPYSLSHAGLVSKSSSQVEKNSEGQPTSHARDYEWKDDAIPPRHAPPCSGSYTQCLHASPHDDSCHICPQPLTQQFGSHDSQVSRNSTTSRTVSWKASSVRSSSPHSKSYT